MVGPGKELDLLTPHPGFFPLTCTIFLLLPFFIGAYGNSPFDLFPPSQVTWPFLSSLDSGLCLGSLHPPQASHGLEGVCPQVSGFA